MGRDSATTPARSLARALSLTGETAALWREAAITAGKHAGSSGDSLPFLGAPSPPGIGRWSLDTIGALAGLGTEHSAPLPFRRRYVCRINSPPLARKAAVAGWKSASQDGRRAPCGPARAQLRRLWIDNINITPTSFFWTIRSLFLTFLFPPGLSNTPPFEGSSRAPMHHNP